MTFVASLAGVIGAAVGLLWGCGLLVARPLLPRRYRPLLPLIAPFLGVSLISAVAHYASAAGASLRSLLWLFVFLAGAGWTVVLLDWRWRRLPRSSVPALVVCLFAFLLAIGPLFSLGYLTTLGATIDGVSYAVRSEYLQDAPLVLPEIEAGKPYLGWVRLQLFLRAGDVFLVGLLNLLTGKRSYELLTVVPALFFALMAGSVYVLARLALGLRRLGALLAATLVAAHNLLLWPVYDNFLSQTIALAFLPLVFAFGIEGQRRPRWRVAALFAILFCGLVSVYPVFAIAALAAVLCVWAVAWLLHTRGARGRALGRAALWWLGTLGLALLWNGAAFVRSVGELQFVTDPSTRGAGNILVFPPAVEILGLIAHAAAAFSQEWTRVPAPVLNVLGLAFAGVAGYGWWRLRPRARLAVAALLLTSALLIAQQRWGAQYPYGYYKMITTVVAEVMILVAAGLAALWQSRRRALRGLAAGAALLLLAVNLKHTLWTQSYVLDHAVVIDRELIGIGQAVSRADPDSWVQIDMKAGLRQYWLGYLIHERKIRFREPLSSGDVDTPGAANAFFRYAVVERELDEQRHGTTFDEPWYDPEGYLRLAGNSRYELRERRDPVLAIVHWDRRWPAQSSLALAPSAGSLSVQLGPEVKEGGIGPGSPRTVQVRLYSLTPSSQLQVAAPSAPMPLGPGGWLVDIDLGCVADGRIRIDHAAGDIVLSDIRVLRTVTGRPGVCLERVPLPTGIVYFEQDDPGNGRVRLRAAVLRPESGGERAYRLGFHIIESKGKHFGVWSLDFPLDQRVQHGSLEIDLRDRSSRGEIDGRPVDLEVTSFELDAGSFVAAAVWWQSNPQEQLRIEPMLWFERGDRGTVQVTRAVPEARLQILSAP